MIRKKLSFLLICFLLLVKLASFISCQKPINDSGKVGLRIEKEYYKSGKLKREIPYFNEQVNGEMKGYYETGELMCVFPMENDQPNGFMKKYYKNGNLESSVPLKGKIINGKVMYFYLSGKTETVLHYKNGQLEENSKDFYESGKLKSKYLIQKDGKYSKKIMFYETGEILFENQYYEDILNSIRGFNKAGIRLNGLVKINYLSGNTYIEGEFIDGYPSGVLKSFYESGKIEFEGTFRSQKPNGTHYYYHETDDIYLEIPYFEGKIHGIVKENDAIFKDYKKEIQFEHGQRIKESEGFNI